MFRHVRTEKDLRTAWRRVARQLHPDVVSGDEERFKSAHHAYGRALLRLRGRVPFTPPRRQRFALACPCCDDTFAVGDTCPRCDVQLCAEGEQQGVRVEPHATAIGDLVARLEKPRIAFDIPIPVEHRATLAALAMFLFGLLHWRIGLVGSAVLFFGFALFVATLDAHERFRRWRPHPWLS